MKVTALIPEDVINEVKKISGGKNITDSLLIALTDYVNRNRIKNLTKKIKTNPLEFIDDFSAEKVRHANREA